MRIAQSLQRKGLILHLSVISVHDQTHRPINCKQNPAISQNCPPLLITLLLIRTVSSGLRHVALVRTDVSEELSASFIRVTRICELGTTLDVTSNRHMLQACVGC
jgi:hypothetical protein